MNKDEANRLKHLSCCLLETLEQSVIDHAEGNLPKNIMDKLGESSLALLEFNQKMVKECKKYE